MRIKNFLFCFAILLCCNISAQNKGVEDLMARQLEYNKNIRTVQGFRVNIFSSTGNNSKKEALQAKQTFVENFPETIVYLVYEEPYFKVKVGNYRTRAEARGCFEKIKVFYPNAYVVKDLIDVKALIGVDEEEGIIDSTTLIESPRE